MNDMNPNHCVFMHGFTCNSPNFITLTELLAFPGFKL